MPTCITPTLLVCPHSPGSRKDRGLLALLSHPQDPKGRTAVTALRSLLPPGFAPLQPLTHPKVLDKIQITPGWGGWDTKSPHFNTGAFAHPVSPALLGWSSTQIWGLHPPAPHFKHLSPRGEEGTLTAGPGGPAAPVSPSLPGRPCRGEIPGTQPRASVSPSTYRAQCRGNPTR